MSGLKRNVASPVKATWELDWQGADNILKIATFDEKKNSSKKRGVPKEIREKILTLERAKTPLLVSRRKLKFRSKKNDLSSEEVNDGLFKRLSKCVFLLIRCFNARKKNAISQGELLFASYDYDAIAVDRCLLNLNLRKILTTPPSLRTIENLRVVASFLRASGAAVSILGPTCAADDENLARLVSYEKYENGRIVAEQGKNLDRFYFVLRGKILLVKEYHVANSIISKTMSMLTKGQTTDADEMMRDVTRNHNLVGKGTVEVLVLDRDDYFALRRDKKSGAKEYLSKHSLLKLFPQQILPDKDGNMLQLSHYPKGMVIFSGETEYEWVYVIKSGECVLTRSQHVKNVLNQKRSLFNKQNAHELGCDKSQTKRHRIMADFRVWRKETSLESIKRDSAIQSIKLLKQPDNAFANKENQIPTTPAFPPISAAADDEKTPLYKVIKPIDAAMAGVSTKSRQVLARPRMQASSSINSGQRKESIENRSTIKRPPPTLRSACLELGRLKPGDIFGLDDLNGADERLQKIALLSNGADVVKIKRRFFLHHAPANLLMQLSSLNHNFPTVSEAQKIIEEIDTWTLYKQSLIKVLKKDNTNLWLSKPNEAIRSNRRKLLASAVKIEKSSSSNSLNSTTRPRMAASAPALRNRHLFSRRNPSRVSNTLTRVNIDL